MCPFKMHIARTRHDSNFVAMNCIRWHKQAYGSDCHLKRVLLGWLAHLEQLHTGAVVRPCTALHTRTPARQ